MRAFRETIKTLVIAVIGALILRVSVVEAFQIPTGSMEDTILPGDFILGNKFVYGITIPFTTYRFKGIRKPEVGDIVIFKYPKDESVNYIKRCIAVAGQIIEIQNKAVHVDGVEVPNPSHVKFVDDHIFPPDWKQRDIYPPDAGNRDNYGPITVPEGYIFVMGDNRDNSLDSRYWGFVPLENLIGEAMMVYWSWDKHANTNLFKKIRWRRIGEIIQ